MTQFEKVETYAIDGVIGLANAAEEALECVENNVPSARKITK